MEQIENRMVRETPTSDLLSDNLASLNGPGWKNLTDGTFVPDGSAFDYALDHCVKFVPPGFHKVEWTQDFREMVVEWFYSDEWVYEDGNKENT